MIKISVVIPCLNEEKTIYEVIKTAKRGLSLLDKKYQSEILVSDNGSTDRSPAIAKKAGAKVVVEKERGYGNAYKTGIKKSRGEIIIMGDADGTYDFSRIPRFVKKIESGYDIILGSRFKGKIEKGAMPLLNRYIGNPFLTGMLNLFYGSNISDAHTGMRAFTKKAYSRMRLTSPGMEFASEMLIKSIAYKLKIAEVPINYNIRLGKSKLSPFSDALRHIKYMLLFSPTYVFIFPGMALFILGISISTYLLPHPQIIFGRLFDIHTMSLSMLVANLGLQIILYGLFSRVYTSVVLHLPSGKLAYFLLKNLSPGKIWALGLAALSLGMLMILIITLLWMQNSFGQLNKVREFIYALGFSFIGTQLIFSSLLLELMKGRYR